ncbi:MAG: adenylate/guanylate cyclase domain-containing protein [Flavisolibacter sp.]
MEACLNLFAGIEKEKEQLASFSELKILGSESHSDYDNLVKLACHIGGAPIAMLSLADKTRIWFKNNCRWQDEKVPPPFSELSLGTEKEIVEVSDTLIDETFKTHRLVTAYPFVRFYAEIPLITADGTKLGTLFILDTKPNYLRMQQRDGLHTLAGQIILQVALKLQKKQLKLLNVGLLKDMQQRIEQKEKILKLFSKFVPPEVISSHLQSEIAGFSDAELKHCAILFCDIRGYTALVENEPPGNAVKILTIFYTVMSDIIKTYSGMVVQYVGDEIFAVFGKPFSFPEYERNAVFCAIEMMNQLTIVNDLCKGITPTPIKIGIGINAGQVITGTLGSDVKIEYCVTGNNVNIAKRIESLTQKKPDTILISESVFEKVNDIIEVMTWEPVIVKGQSEPLQIYQVLGKKDNDHNSPY